MFLHHQRLIFVSGHRQIGSMSVYGLYVYMIFDLSCHDFSHTWKTDAPKLVYSPKVIEYEYNTRSCIREIVQYVDMPNMLWCFTVVSISFSVAHRWCFQELNQQICLARLTVEDIYECPIDYWVCHMWLRTVWPWTIVSNMFTECHAPWT